jgi:hypothetical protein
MKRGIEAMEAKSLSPMSPKTAKKLMPAEEKEYTADPDGVHVISRKRTVAETEVLKRKDAGQ